MKCTSKPINSKTYEFFIGHSKEALWKFVRVKRPKSYIMIRTATIFMLGALLHVGVTKVVAQGDSNPRPIFGDKEATQRIDDYLNLLSQGYSEIEIFQDLGNANLLSENYDSAAFWFERLLENTQDATQRQRFQQRLTYATKKSLGMLENSDKDWTKEILKDYKSAGPSHYLQNASNVVTIQGEHSMSNTKKESINEMEGTYTPKLAITANGKVAFFSRAVAQKPEYGIFSKKEVVHELYRAENINGAWKNIKKIKVCPKRFSAKHPTVSADGSRLFFASNMPGTYGKYDIYVADIKADGNLGLPKNLGPKVNTRKNDMYPSLVNGTTLLFASNGRKGHGGFDLFAVTVKGNQLGRSKNLGNGVNSRYDDYALTFSPSKGMGFVLSNRGDQRKVNQYAIAPKGQGLLSKVEKDDKKLWEVLNDDSKTEYSSTVFEDK